MERFEDVLDLLCVLYESINGRPCELVQLMELVLCLRDPQSYGVAMGAIEDEAKRLRERAKLKDDAKAPPPPPGSTALERAEVMYQTLVDLAQLRMLAGARHETNIDLLHVDPAVHLEQFRLRVIDRLEKGAPMERWPELLRPRGDYTLNQRRLYDSLKTADIDAINQEFVERANVVIARLGVTANAFLNTTKGTEAAELLLDIIRDALARIATITAQPFVSPTLVQFATPEDLLLASTNVPSSVKTLLLPDVPDRGGIPEGFSAFKVQADVIKSNAQLKGQVVRVNEDRGTIWVGEKHGEEATRTRRFVKPTDLRRGGGLSRRDREEGSARRVVYEDSPQRSPRRDTDSPTRGGTARTRGTGSPVRGAGSSPTRGSPMRGSPMRGSPMRGGNDSPNRGSRGSARRVVYEEVRRADLREKNPPLGEWH